MEYTAGTSWIQQQHVSGTLDGRSPANGDWKESAVSTSGAAPSGVQSSMDLSDFGMDLSAPSSTPTLPQQPQTSYYPFPHNGNFYLAGTPGTYGGMQYTTHTWPGNTPSPHIPLSSYSSLNGATTSTPASFHSSQLPSSSSQPPSQIMIDPTLNMTMNGSSSSPPPQHYPSPFLSSHPHSQTIRAQYTYQPAAPPSSLSSFVHTTPSHFQSHGQQPVPHQIQRQPSIPQIHSPYTIQSPPSITTTSSASSPPISPSAFYAQPPPPPPSGPTPEQLREGFFAGLRPLLQSTSFTGGGAVQKLTGHIENYGILKVDVPTRLEVLSKIRDNAGNHYFRAWAENEVAMRITKKWLIDSVSETNAAASQATMPLLHILDRLPMTLGCLKESGIGKEVKRVSKSTSSNAAIRDMASNIASKWRALLTGQQAPASTKPGEDTDARIKKRKAEEPPSAGRGIPLAKKSSATALPSALKTPTAATKKVVSTKTVVKDGPKTDSSFFSASKPKPKLPDFKKAPVTVKKEPDLNVAQPSSYNPFEEIVKSLKPRKDSPVVATPPPAVSSAASALPTDTRKLGKKKSVTWAPDNALELVKIIERAVYDDDPADAIHGAHTIRELDRGEGAALIAHLFEEQIDWSEPLLIDIPSTIDVPRRGKDSIERTEQEKREETALGALYISDAQIPESASEPSSQLPEDQVDATVKVMLSGAEADAVFWNATPPATPDAGAGASVADLVGQLAGVIPDAVVGDAAQSGGSFDSSLLANFRPEQLQQLVQQAAALHNPKLYPVPAPGPPASGPRANGEQEWQAMPSYTEYNTNDRGYEDAGKERRWDDNWGGRGKGRGRGRGRGGDNFRGRKRPCSFFMQGRCKYGDQCDFSHDLTLEY